MQHTTNYNLPQWEDTDTVKREDMNGAFAAVDTAIAAAGKPMAYDRIMELTTTQAAESVILNVGDIDFTRYLRVDVFVVCNVTGTAISVQINGMTENHIALGKSASGGGYPEMRNYIGEMLPASSTLLAGVANT